MKKQMTSIAAAALSAGMLFLMSGCAATTIPVIGNQSTPRPTSTPAPTSAQPTETPIAIITSTPTAELTPVPVQLTPIAEADEYLNIIGTKAEGDSVFRIRLVNSTGLAVTALRVLPTDSDELPRSLLSKGDVFADKEERILYYDTAFVYDGGKTDAPFDMMLTFEDGSSYRMTRVPFTDMEEGVIYFNDGVAYIVYLSKSAGRQVTTKDAELKASGLLDDTDQGSEDGGNSGSDYDEDTDRGEETDRDEDGDGWDEDQDWNEDEDRNWDEDEDRNWDEDQNRDEDEDQNWDEDQNRDEDEDQDWNEDEDQNWDEE